MDDERDNSILLWPVRVISALRVHLIVLAAIGTVWSAGWVRSMQSTWTANLRLPPLTTVNGAHDRPAPAGQPAGIRPGAVIESAPAPSSASGPPRIAQPAWPHADRVATVRDGLD